MINIEVKTVKNLLTKVATAAATTVGLSVAIALDAPNANAATFGGIDFPGGVTSFADAVVSFKPLFSGGPAPFEVPGQPDTLVDPTTALGAPDASEPFNQDISLGNGGRITLQFIDNALIGNGTADPDLQIFETGSLEAIFVEISKNGVDWFSVGSAPGGSSGIDIDAFGFGASDLFFFVRLTDDPNQGGQVGPTVGADLDAVGAISSASVPEPASVLGLLAFGAMGAGSVLKKKQA